MVVSSVAVAQTANSMVLTLLVGGVFCHLIFTKALVLSLSQQKFFFFFFFFSFSATALNDRCDHKLLKKMVRQLKNEKKKII